MSRDLNFFCRHCSKAVCRDCQSIAIEALELSARRGQALMEAEQELKAAVEEKERAERRAADWERIMKLGQNALVLAWMNDHTPAQLLQKVVQHAAEPGEVEHHANT